MRLIKSPKEEKQPIQTRKTIKKVWKYKLNQFCIEHNQKYSRQCVKCELRLCSQCKKPPKKYTHDFEQTLRSENKGPEFYYEKIYTLKDAYCRSNVVQYVNKQTGRKMLIFCTINTVNELDIEMKWIVRQFRMHDYYYNLRIIDNQYLLTYSQQTIRLFTLKDMKQIRFTQMPVVIYNMHYFQYPNLLTVSGEKGGLYLLSKESLRIIKRIDHTEKFIFEEVDTLYDNYLLCQTTDAREKHVYVHTINVMTGRISQLFEGPNSQRYLQRLNYSFTLKNCSRKYLSVRDKIAVDLHEQFSKFYLTKVIGFDIMIYVNYLQEKMILFDLRRFEVIQVIKLPLNSFRYYNIFSNYDCIIVPANDLIIYTRQSFNQET